MGEQPALPPGRRAAQSAGHRTTGRRRIPLTLLGLLQYLTPTLQLVCGVAVLGEALPPTRLAGFVLVWVALAVLAADALGTARRRTAAPVPIPPPVAEAA